MLRRLQPYVWIAAFGMLVHLGASGAAVWCKAMGLMAASCCPAEMEEEPTLLAPSDCCRPSLEPAQAGLGEPTFDHAPAMAVLPWEGVALEEASWVSREPTPAPRATPPPLLLLSTIVIVR